MSRFPTKEPGTRRLFDLSPRASLVRPFEGRGERKPGSPAREAEEPRGNQAAGFVGTGRIEKDVSEGQIE